MVTRVFKYELPRRDGLVELKLPRGAKFCSAGAQGDNWMLWFQVNADAHAESRHFRVFGTGHTIEEEGLIFLATFFQGSFVWHLFESVTTEPYVANSGRNFSGHFGDNS